VSSNFLPSFYRNGRSWNFYDVNDTGAISSRIIKCHVDIKKCRDFFLNRGKSVVYLTLDFMVTTGELTGLSKLNIFPKKFYTYKHCDKNINYFITNSATARKCISTSK
jgi:hypothetical protein